MSFDYKFNSLLTGFRKSAGTKVDMPFSDIKALDAGGKGPDGLLTAAESIRAIDLKELSTTSGELGAIKPISPEKLIKPTTNPSFVVTHLNTKDK